MGRYPTSMAYPIPAIAGLMCAAHVCAQCRCDCRQDLSARQQQLQQHTHCNNFLHYVRRAKTPPPLQPSVMGWENVAWDLDTCDVRYYTVFWDNLRTGQL